MTPATVGLALVAAGTLVLLAVAAWVEQRAERIERRWRQGERYRRERDAALAAGWWLTAGRIEAEWREWQRAGMTATKEERATNVEQR